MHTTTLNWFHHVCTVTIEGKGTMACILQTLIGSIMYVLSQLRVRELWHAYYNPQLVPTYTYLVEGKVNIAKIQKPFIATIIHLLSHVKQKVTANSAK
jgi:hypothetical protein